MVTHDAPELPTPLMHPLTDNDRLVEMLSQSLDQPAETVRATLYRAESDPTQYFHDEFARFDAQPYVWSDEMKAFYELSDAYLFGGIVWNRKPLKVDLRRWIAQFLVNHQLKNQRILTVGDGVGVDSLYLSQCGHDVTYSEMSPKCVRFARQLFEQNQQSIAVVEDPETLPTESYEIVFCLDVLEHLSDPIALVERFAQWLKPGGLLIVHAPFYYVSHHNPTHLESNRKYSGDFRRMFARQGFQLVSGRLFWDPLILAKQGGSVQRGGRFWRNVLRMTGLMLAVGRIWSFPHCYIAGKMTDQQESQWLKGLEPVRES